MVGAKSYYDVVVVGGSLGAAAAGALLARRGFRVAWIRHDARPSAYAHEGLALHRASQALTFADAPAFRRILSELALGPLVRRRLTALDPLYQVVMPGHRLDVRAAPDALLAEVAREFPEVRRPVEEFYALVARAHAELDALLGLDLAWPPDGFFERRDAARAAAATQFGRRGGEPADPLGDLPADHPFRTFVHAQARFASALDPDTLTPLRLLRAHGVATRAGGFFEGGRDGLLRVLEEKIVQHGGDVRPRDRVARILTERGRARAVELGTTDERLGCAFVLTSLDAAAAMRLAGYTPSRAGVERLLARAPRYYRYVLNVVLRAEGVPAGMSPRVFAVAVRSRPLAEENLLSIETAPADAHGRAVMTVTALLPRAGVEEGGDFLRKQRARVLDALAEVVPFLRRNLLAVDSPHDGLAYEDLARGAVAPVADRWRAEPEPMSVVEAPEPGSFLGLCALPVRTEVKGLLLVGPQVVPGLGEEGEMIAALSAARIVTRSDRTKEKLRRDLWSKVDV